MLTRPAGLSDADVAAAIAREWGVRLPEVHYAQVGFGSHHWSVVDGAGTPWFATVDDVADEQAYDRLTAALALSAYARRAGLGFVVAPIPTVAGVSLVRLGGRHTLALYPHVEGESGGFGEALTQDVADEVTGLLCALHGLAVPAEAHRLVETFTLSGRDVIESALREAAGGQDWPVPYGGQLRELLRRRHGDIARALRRDDELVQAAGPQQERMVLTHGEPHPGNFVCSPEGLRLVDWDTAKLAPPERDVWLAARTGGRGVQAYEDMSGRRLVPELLARYELAWSLADVAVYVELLRGAAVQTADTAWSWDALVETVADLTPRP